MTDHHIRTTCRLCGSTSLETLLTLPATALANEYPREPNPKQDRFPLYLVGCGTCGHVQLPAVVDPKRLFPADYPYQSGTSAVFREHLRELALAVVTLAKRDGARGRVLDVACNDGTLVGELISAGANVATGIDPAAPEGLHRAFFTEEWAHWHKNNDYGLYDVVTALNVFAHVDDLDDFTLGVATILEHDGLFIFEVGYLPDVVAKGLFDVVYHEHLSYHHLSPLVRFFEKHRMRLIDAHRIDSQGGSIRCFVRNCDAHQAQSARLRDLLDDESRGAIWQGVRDLNGGGIDAAIRGTRDELAAFHKRHGDFAVYGAPAKLTTLLTATGSVPRVSFVVDDNPLKVGRYVPGTAIPILPTSALYERKPNGVMIASWNFAADIKARHAELGCEWLVPFPRRA